MNTFECATGGGCVLGSSTAALPHLTGRLGPGVMAITAFPVIDRLREDITKSPNGTAFFAHLLTPHAPYVYDADCELRLEGSQWLWPKAPPVFLDTD